MNDSRKDIWCFKMQYHFHLLGMLVSYRFRMKYHPEEYDKRVEEARARLLTRCRVFVRLMEMNRIDQVTVDIDQSENLVKLLDSGKTSSYPKC
jgi:SERRATE/Ars2, N-terminal domain